MKKRKSEESTNYSKYFSEIRRKLIKLLIAFSVGFTFGFIYFRPILEFFFKVFKLEQLSIVVTSPFQVFNLAVNTGIILGILTAFPFFILNFYAFIKPALKEKEKKAFFPLLFSSLTLFIFGFSFGLVLMRWVVFGLSQVFLGSQIGNFWDVGVFFSQIILTSVFLGLIFQFPILLFILVKLGLIELSNLEKKRYYIIAGSFVFVALLPPTDAFSLILMVTPLIIMFELTILILKKGVK